MSQLQSGLWAVVGRRRRTRPRASTRRALVIAAVAFIVAIALILLVDAARARDFAADRHRRVQEFEAREPWLYQQLADRDAIHESQRQVYMARFRRLEDQLQQKQREIFVLQDRLRGTEMPTVQ